MRSLRLTLLCLFVAGCAADLPSGSTPPEGGPEASAPRGDALSAPTAPGSSTPPLRSHTVPSGASDDPGSPSDTPTATTSPSSGGTSSTPTPRPSTAGTATPKPASSTSTPAPTPTPKPLLTLAPTPSAPPGNVVATFSGNGPGRTPAFTIPPGYTEFKITHTGSGDFTAWLLNDSRKRLFTIMMRTGSFSEVSPLYTPNGGTRYIEVTEGGSWSITVVSD